MGTILIVEDGEVNREILKHALNEYDILEACHGEEALEVLYENRDKISVILLDLLMPKMGGIEFLEKMVEKEGEVNLPVLVLTGDDDPESRQKCFSFGIMGFIEKPFDVKHIKELVKELAEI